jgi:uncharacterized protein YukJ
MPVQNYGVLTGTISALMDSSQAQQKDPHGKPHYMVEVSAGGALYRAAVNVLSDDNPPDLQFYMNTQYQHPILQTVQQFKPGFQPLASAPGTGALDYVKEDLLDLSLMTIVPPMDGPGGRDLDDIMNKAFGSPAAVSAGAPSPGTVYFFGSGYTDPGADEYFGFSPSPGIHNIHMNQGSTGSFADENGAYQDGAVLIYYPGPGTWTAMFFKFQSQDVQ